MLYKLHPKSLKISRRSFSKAWRSSYWAHFVPFCPKNPRERVFQRVSHKRVNTLGLNGWNLLLRAFTSRTIWRHKSGRNNFQPFQSISHKIFTRNTILTTHETIEFTESEAGFTLLWRRSLLYRNQFAPQINGLVSIQLVPPSWKN